VTRRLLLLGVVACAALTVWAVITEPVLVTPFVLLGAAALVAVFPDVLRDHPDEEEMRRRDLADRLEDRRRRGLAGWQKPVAPPPAGSLPGGLPPKPRG
jgi:hypothetical protein